MFVEAVSQPDHSTAGPLWDAAVDLTSIIVMPLVSILLDNLSSMIGRNNSWPASPRRLDRETLAAQFQTEKK